MLSELSRDIAEEQFQPQMFQPISKYRGTHNPRLMNPKSVLFYRQGNVQNLDFDLP